MTTAPHFTFVALDARAASRASTLALLAERPTLGIEVTDRELASACQLGNVDPQHGHHQSWTGWPAHVKGEAAILFALRLPLGLIEPDAVLATVRPDLDSVGAMAVIVLRSACGFAAPYVGHRSPLDPGRVNAVDIGVTERIEAVAQADSFRPGPWAPRPIPTPENLWPLSERQEAADGHRALAHIAAICSPRPGQPSLPLEERVAIVACWIMWGDPIEPGFDESPGSDSWANPARKYDEWAILKACGVNPAMSAPVLASNIATARRVVDASRQALAKELAKPGAIKVECRRCGDLMGHMICDGGGRECVPGIAQVRVSHAGALGAGYCLAPVVAAFDQADPGKVTIAAAEDGHVDFARLRGALNEAEDEALIAHLTTAPMAEIADWAHAIVGPLIRAGHASLVAGAPAVWALGLPGDPAGGAASAWEALQVFAGGERSLRTWPPREPGDMTNRQMSRACDFRLASGPDGPDQRVQTCIKTIVRTARHAGKLPAWGGPRNLLGSPHGDGTRLSEATIMRLVEAALA